jgi:hypothetical protein
MARTPEARLRWAGRIILATDDEGFPMRVEGGLLYVDGEGPMPEYMRHVVQGYLPEIKLVLSGTAAFVERRLAKIAKAEGSGVRLRNKDV